MYPMKLTLKNAWMFSNGLFISMYSLYLLSWVFRLPFVAYIPRFATNSTIATAYAFTMYPQSKNFDHLLNNPNMYCFLFFMTNPLLIFMLPFYMSSVVNISSAIL